MAVNTDLLPSRKTEVENVRKNLVCKEPYLLLWVLSSRGKSPLVNEAFINLN